MNTKLSHTNPCFWTALWNPQYYDHFMSKGPGQYRPRDQKVFVLNLRADMCLENKVRNVHVEKNISNAEITPDDIKSFCKRWFPGQYSEFCADMEAHPETLYLDFESILTGLEQLLPYKSLLEVIRTGTCKSVLQKANMAAFLIIHFLRSSAILQSSIQISKRFGRPKFEYYWWLKQILSDTNTLFNLTKPLAFSQWHFYRSDKPDFALPDTPILINHRSIMVALSPYLLLEVFSTLERKMERYYCHNTTHHSKIREYRRRAIGNTFKELICFSTEIANEYAHTYEWTERIRQLSATNSPHDLFRHIDVNHLGFLRSFLRLNDDEALL